MHAAARSFHVALVSEGGMSWVFSLGHLWPGWVSKVLQISCGRTGLGIVCSGNYMQVNNMSPRKKAHPMSSTNKFVALKRIFLLTMKHCYPF